MMTGPAPDPSAEDLSAEPTSPDPTAETSSLSDRVRGVCPYLLAEDGASRRLGPWRGHRCQAVRPPARLAIDKQRRLCLVTDHLTCATFLAARAAVRHHDALPVAGVDLEKVTRWSITRTTSSIVDPGSRLDGLWGRLSGTAAQAVLGGALVIALLAMVRGQFVPGGVGTASPTPGASAGPSATASAETTAPPTQRPSPSAEPSPVAVVTPPPTPTPPPPATPTPGPSGSQIYTVRSGDTLWDIAIAYNTTVKALQQLNGIGPNDALHVGQKLKIP